MIEEHLREKYLGQIVFLELQEEKKEDYDALFLEAPIPLFQEDMVEMVRGQETESISYEKIIPPMATILALDSNFPHYGVYRDFFRDKLELVSYLENQRRESFNGEDLDFYYIYGKLLYEFRGKGEDTIEYAWALEKWYDALFQEEAEEEELEKILGEILGLYEAVLREEEDNAFVNDRLGHIYALLGQYIKSKLYLERALANYREPYQMESAALVREKLGEIENYAYLEGAEVYLSYNRLEESLRELENIQEEYFEIPRVNYLKAMNYYQMGEYGRAEEYMEIAYGKDRQNPQILNDYAIIKSSLGKTHEALELLENMEDSYSSYELFHNRGVLYYQEEQYEKALLDLKRAHELNPSPELASLILNVEERYL